MRLYYIYIIFTLFISCIRSQNNVCHNKYQNYSYDSSYISCYFYNISQRDSSVYWFEKDRFFDSDSTNKLPIFSVDTIVYSADFLRLYSILIIEYDTSIVDLTQKYYEDFNGKSLFKAYGIIGYRDNINSTLKLYEYSMLMLTAIFSYEDVKEAARKYYFDNIRNDSFWYSYKNENPVDKKLEYSINECGFWDSFIWKRGLIKKGYYNFEIDYEGLGNEPSIIYMPVLNDSICKCYRK